MSINSLHTDNFRWTAIGIFLILCGNHLGLHISGGEEQYLAFARQYMDPGWIRGSFSLTEYAGTRLLFQILVGALLTVTDFTVAVVLLRMAAYAGLAWAMAKLLVRLDFRWYWALVVIQLFVMSEQSFFGMEWVVKSFEPKVVAYIFVFLALADVVDSKPVRAAAWLGAASWFHILVGGWVYVCLMLYYILTKEKTLVRTGLTYVLVVAPLVVYMYLGYFAGPAFESEFDLDMIYCYYRLPHHLGLFESWEFFRDRHLTGVVLSAIVLIAAILSRRFYKGRLRKLLDLLMIALCITLFFVAVAWADRYVLDYRLAFILKYYPFRLSAFALFATITLVAGGLWELTARSGRVGVGIRRGITLAVLILGIFQVVNHIRAERRPIYPEPFLDAVEFVREETPDSSVFALVNLPLDADHVNAFIRLTERENFSVYKFVPGEKTKLDRWYRRQLDLIDVNKDNSMVRNLEEKYSVTHILSDLPIPGLKELYRNGSYFVYVL